MCCKCKCRRLRNKKSSDYDVTKCGSFYPLNDKSCVAVEGTCQEKECSDFKSPYCDNFKRILEEMRS